NQSTLHLPVFPSKSFTHFPINPYIHRVKKVLPLLILLTLLQFTNVVDFMIVMPLSPHLIDIFHIDSASFNWIVASYGISSAVSGFVSALFLDRFNRKTALLVTYTGFIAGTFFCAFAWNFESMIIARIFTGLFGGIIGAQSMTIIADLVPFEKRATAMGIFMSAFAVGSIIGVPAGLFIANLWDWHMPFICIAVLSVPILVLCWFLIPDLKSHLKPGEKNKLMDVFDGIRKSRNQQFAILSMFILMLGHFMVVPQVANYMQKNVGFSNEDILWIYIVGGITAFISSPLVGKLADKKGKAKIFFIFTFLTFIPVTLITHLRPIPLWEVLVVTSIFFAFSSGRFSPLQAIISETVEPQYRGGFMSIVSSIQSLGLGLGSLVTSFIIYDSARGEIVNFNIAGYVCMAITVFAMLSVSMIKLPKK
ncbi:MAG: MFS transporter, partial [Bacteroidota bacterium]